MYIIIEPDGPCASYVTVNSTLTDNMINAMKEDKVVILYAPNCMIGHVVDLTENQKLITDPIPRCEWA